MEKMEEPANVKPGTSPELEKLYHETDSCVRCGGAQQVLGNRRQRRALGRARPNLAGAGGGQGKSLPRSFRLLQLERNLSIICPGIR